MFDALGPDELESPPIDSTIKTRHIRIMKIHPPIAPYCFVFVSKTFAIVGFVIRSVDPSEPVVTGAPGGAGGAPGANEAPGGDPDGDPGAAFMS